MSRLPSTFWAKVDLDGADGCWLWTGAKNSRGYGQFSVDGRSRSTHRLAYEGLVDTIPAGLGLDHLCRVRACCNPAHLEPVTSRANQARSPLTTLGRTRCKRGHPLTGANVYHHPRGSRVCKTCRAAYARARRKAVAA